MVIMQPACFGPDIKVYFSFWYVWTFGANIYIYTYIRQHTQILPLLSFRLWLSIVTLRDTLSTSIAAFCLIYGILKKNWVICVIWSTHLLGVWPFGLFQLNYFTVKMCFSKMSLSPCMVWPQNCIILLTEQGWKICFNFRFSFYWLICSLAYRKFLRTSAPQYLKGIYFPSLSGLDGPDCTLI